MDDVIVVGGGFAGVTTARELALRGRTVLLLEARERLGGRTWTAPWDGTDIEYGGGWVHWHQPHTWSEITRAGLAVNARPDDEMNAWYVGGDRRSGAIADRDAIAERGWDRFVAGVEDALPLPYEPLAASAALARFDHLTIAARMDEIDLDAEERDVLAAELEALASGFLDDAGAVSVLRWHALSGGSLELTQYACGRVTLREGTGGLLHAIHGQAAVETRLGTPVASITRLPEHVEVATRDGGVHAARAAVVAVPLNALGAIEFTPALPEAKQRAIALGQASRGAKVFIRARGPAVRHTAVRPGHPFGYLSTEHLLDDGTQILIGFGRDAEACDARDRARVQRQLDEILPGYEVLDSTAHNWLADEFSRGTWAIHRPDWYTTHHRAMQAPEGRIAFAGSDLANGWAGFIDGAIESGLRAAREALVLAGGAVAPVA